MAQKKKSKQVVLPRGVFIYPSIMRPDEYKGVENYKIKTKMPLAVAQPIIDMVDKALLNQKKLDEIQNGGDPMTYKEEYVPYEIENGFVTFNAKLPRFGGKVGQKFEQRPDVFDAKNKPLPQGTEVMGGSEGPVVVDMTTWTLDNGTVGVSFRLKAVQVLKLSDRVERDAASYGFAETEGFDASVPTDTDDEGHGDVPMDTSKREQY